LVLIVGADSKSAHPEVANDTLTAQRQMQGEGGPYLFHHVRQISIMVPNFWFLRLPIALVGVLLLSACGELPLAQRDDRQTGAYSRDQREKAMKFSWNGRPYHELVQAYGAPRLVLNIPARPARFSVVVYERLDSTTDCIDAFTVVQDEMPVVNDYFCR
jgi:hypothetical protein